MNNIILAIFNEAVSALNVRDFKKAEVGFRRVIESDSSHVPALNLLTIVLMSLGRFSEAEPLIARAVKLNQSSDVSFYNYGLIAKQLNQPRKAYEQFTKALKLNPKVRETWNNRGTVCNDLAEYEAAISDFDRSIELDRNYADPYSNKGKSLLQLNRHDDALAAYDKALSIRPDLGKAWLGRGHVLGCLKRNDEALVSYGKALSIEPDLEGAWLGRGNILADLKRYDEAFAAYDKALSLKPDLAEAWLGRGNAFNDLRRHVEAFAAFDRALSIDPNLGKAWLGRGNAFMCLGRYEEALAAYDQAISMTPDLGEAWLGRGTVFTHLGRHDEAFAAYDKAFSFGPGLPSVEGARLFSKLHCCVWADLESEQARLIESVRSGRESASPLVLLSIDALPEDQLRCADAWVGRNARATVDRLPDDRPSKSDKIRVGYLSADLREHPVGYLAAGLFESHDRSRFETYAFSIGPSDNSDLRARLEKSFFDFADLHNRSDDEIVSRIKDSRIDILVDLMGHTQGQRLSVLARRPAPILVNYLGFAGTVGGGLLDYVLADKTVIPAHDREYFSEKVVWLPHCFMPHDNKGRVISPEPSDRRDHGLPADGIVFCCFNNAYKINPETFQSWMRILKKVDCSVLWLSDLREVARNNLRGEAAGVGIDPHRLVFSKRLGSPADHLARHQLADLFLDTLPYNAHTTASDALFAGLPLLTQTGNTFAGRVASSLLNVLRVPELIARSREEYEERAIELALNPGKLHSIKEKLGRNRSTTPLFDTALFTRHVEAAYEAMYRRYQAGLSPDHIELQASQ